MMIFCTSKQKRAISKCSLRSPLTKAETFWAVLPSVTTCGPVCGYERFGGINHLHLQCTVHIFIAGETSNIKKEIGIKMKRYRRERTY